MNQQKQTITKYLNQIHDEIKEVEKAINEKEISKYLKNSRFELLHVIHLLKLKQNGQN